MEISAGIVVFLREGNKILYLLLHYEEEHWDFPKGHVEKGERIEQAALRETKEETGLSPFILPGFKEIIEYFYTNREKKSVKKQVHFFLGEANIREVRLSSEHIGYEWLYYEDALERLTYKTAKDILRKAHDFLMQLRKI